MMARPAASARASACTTWAPSTCTCGRSTGPAPSASGTAASSTRACYVWHYLGYGLVLRKLNLKKTNFTQTNKQPHTRPHSYYKDYVDLERHFRKEHHLCEDAECLAQRFVVFGHPLDLHAHVVNAHPERAQASRRRLELDVNAFRVRGQQGVPAEGEDGDGDGDAGDEAGGSNREGWALNGAAPSTAAASNAEAFPELSTAATQAGMARAPSATGGQRRGPAFPPLSSSANGEGSAAAAARRSSQLAAASQRPTALAAARALLQPMPVVVTHPTTGGAWGSGKVPATVAASQALLQQRQHPSSSSSEGGRGGADDGLVDRNRRFAAALGIAGEIEGQAAALRSVVTAGEGEEGGEDAFRLDLERPVYPRELLAWASDSNTKLEVQRLEERIAAFLRFVSRWF